MHIAVLMFALMTAMDPAWAEAAKPVKLVVLGDSLSAGLGLPAQDAFPTKLQKALQAKGIAVDMTNAGVSGDTSSGGRDRLDWSVPDGTDGVIIELGANDALQGLDPAATKATLEKIITELKARGLPILLAGMEAPPNLGKEYVEQFRALYADLAQRYDLILYPFFLDGVALDDKYTLGDGMHPNAEGVARIVDGILPKVEELLAKEKPRP
jgi:acyl-CoA thioesterase-1